MSQESLKRERELLRELEDAREAHSWILRGIVASFLVFAGGVTSFLYGATHVSGDPANTNVGPPLMLMLGLFGSAGMAWCLVFLVVKRFESRKTLKRLSRSYEDVLDGF